MNITIRKMAFHVKIPSYPACSSCKYIMQKRDELPRCIIFLKKDSTKYHQKTFYDFHTIVECRKNEKKCGIEGNWYKPKFSCDKIIQDK